MREQEVLAGPQIAHCGSRCVWAGTQLIDHLREEERVLDNQTLFFIDNELNIKSFFNGQAIISQSTLVLLLPGSRALPSEGPPV